MTIEKTAGAPSGPPVKVIHVVESMGQGAVESWLLRALRAAQEMQIPTDWTFYCALGADGPQDDAAKALGARVINSPVPVGQKLAFMRALRAELRRGGYDVLDCHHDLLSAVYLASAIGVPIRKRFVHVHNAANALPTPYPLKHAILEPILKRLCLMFADRIIGVSNLALDSFLRGAKQRVGRDIVQFCGVDGRPFEGPAVDCAEFRRQLGLAGDAKIVLFAGRLVPEKNPLFALEVMTEMQRQDPAVVGLFVGSGNLEGALRRRISEQGLDSCSFCLGWRDDLPAIMRCCDCYIHTGPEQPPEGFGFTVVEAQLAGLRLLLSQGISDDALLRTARFRRLAVAAGSRAWADAAFELLAEPAPCRESIMAEFKGSPIDLQSAMPQLLALYNA